MIWFNYLIQVSEASSVKPMKKEARMQINKSTFFLIVALTYSTSAFSDDLQILPFAKPDLNFSSIFSQKAATDFSSIQDATRSSSGDAGSPQNVFLKVLPSAVKVLTNDGHGTGVVISNGKSGGLCVHTPNSSGVWRSRSTTGSRWPRGGPTPWPRPRRGCPVLKATRH